ncbi:hypothetical protein [Chelatococcus asaccharovorans]|uniref:hypothetical protein n=1 Tax=Chelatococcus asaccharovorans TaxID=28210 RepID=UPI00224C72F2|nr:hypothetical protein [Chelatococcus asaccharovorans]CAH1672049.1 conserved hypothetical protein [Chelatococcus asaccharovorans]CAH1676535.1 conserved hypothetical protein [Chelatococcus asaccharovorans]
MARLQPVGLQFDAAIKETLAATHQGLVALAKREHAKVMKTDPRPASFTRFVDGAKGAPEAQVKPAGVIEYVYPRLEAVVQFAMETLFDRSPVDSGHYRNSHTIFVDGMAVANLKALEPGAEVSIANFTPYARKIELGTMKMRLPGHVYEVTERIVKRRFGNLASIKFTYRGIVGGAIAQGKAHGNSDLRYPALIIRER